MDRLLVGIPVWPEAVGLAQAAVQMLAGLEQATVVAACPPDLPYADYENLYHLCVRAGLRYRPVQWLHPSLGSAWNAAITLAAQEEALCLLFNGTTVLSADRARALAATAYDASSDVALWTCQSAPAAPGMRLAAFGLDPARFYLTIGLFDPAYDGEQPLACETLLKLWAHGYDAESSSLIPDSCSPPRPASPADRARFQQCWRFPLPDDLATLAANAQRAPVARPFIAQQVSGGAASPSGGR